MSLYKRPEQDEPIGLNDADELSNAIDTIDSIDQLEFSDFEESADFFEQDEFSGLPVQKRRRSGIETAILYLRIIVPIIAAVILFMYIKDKSAVLNITNLPLPILCLALTVGVIELAIPSIVKAFTGSIPAPLTSKSIASKSNAKRYFLMAAMAAIGIRVIMTVIGMLIYKHHNTWFQGSLFDLWRVSWMKGNTDAQHYLKIAEIGYVNEGNDRLLLVFFPMLPMLIRLFNFIFTDGFISAQIINTVSGSLAAGVLYLTFSHVMDGKRAFVSVMIALLLPGAIFMNSPMTEPLFMLFTACCFYYLQKENFLLAGLFAALAGFTRSLGVLLAVPIALFGICCTVRDYRTKIAANGTKRLFTVLAALIISTLGTIMYLYINHAVSGDALRFLEYQRSNWYQGFGLFIDTPRYMMDHMLTAFRSGNISLAISLWLPGLTAVIGSLVIYIFKAKRLPATYTAFFIVYFIASVSATWLLSAVRYLTVALPLPAAIGHGLKKGWQQALAILVCAALSVGYITMYMYGLGVY